MMRISARCEKDNMRRQVDNVNRRSRHLADGRTYRQSLEFPSVRMKLQISGPLWQGLKYLKMSTTHRKGQWRGRRPRASAEGVRSGQGRCSPSPVWGSGGIAPRKFWNLTVQICSFFPRFQDSLLLHITHSSSQLHSAHLTKSTAHFVSENTQFLALPYGKNWEWKLCRWKCDILNFLLNEKKYRSICAGVSL